MMTTTLLKSCSCSKHVPNLIEYCLPSMFLICYFVSFLFVHLRIHEFCSQIIQIFFFEFIRLTSLYFALLDTHNLNLHPQLYRKSFLFYGMIEILRRRDKKKENFLENQIFKHIETFNLLTFSIRCVCVGEREVGF